MLLKGEGYQGTLQSAETNICLQPASEQLVAPGYPQAATGQPMVSSGVPQGFEPTCDCVGAQAVLAHARRLLLSEGA